MYYAVIFCSDWEATESKFMASRHKFDTLKEAREFADNYWNAHIARITEYGAFEVHTRQYLRLYGKRRIK